jgi:hypothetical protein
MLLPAGLKAESWLTLESVRSQGVEPMTKDEAVAFFSRERQRGETDAQIHTLWFRPDGGLTGEFCFKRYMSCPKPGRGKGEWSVADDGTLRLFVNWVSHISTEKTGKLYKHGGYVYLFDETTPGGGSKAWEYRFQQ